MQQLYVTGVIALNFPFLGRVQALWHTTSTLQEKAFPAWRIAGISFTCTSHLLGSENLHDVSDLFLSHGIINPPTSVAAGYERVLFDILYHHLVVRRTPVVGVQRDDIDDAVDFKLVSRWAKRLHTVGDLAHQDLRSILTWLA